MATVLAMVFVDVAVVMRDDDSVLLERARRTRLFGQTVACGVLEFAKSLRQLPHNARRGRG